MRVTADAPDIFWSQLPGGVWSNSLAGDSVRIRAVLMRPRFGILLEICRHFGLARVRAEWEVLLGEAGLVSPAVHTGVDRMLAHIEQGRKHAQG
jgi:hypothetical protein